MLAADHAFGCKDGDKFRSSTGLFNCNFSTLAAFSIIVSSVRRLARNSCMEAAKRS